MQSDWFSDVGIDLAASIEETRQRSPAEPTPQLELNETAPRACFLAGVRHRGPEANDVSVGVDNHALVLAPLRVLRRSDVGSGRGPSLRHLVRVFNKHIRGGGRRPRAVAHHEARRADGCAQYLDCAAPASPALLTPPARAMAAPLLCRVQPFADRAADASQRARHRVEREWMVPLSTRLKL